MMHESDEVLNLVRLMCKKTIALQEGEEKNECVKKNDIDDIAYLARLVTAELGETE